MRPLPAQEKTPRWQCVALLRFSMPVVLVVVALGQQVVVTTAHLSPWKGAGFGMFSTVDDPRTRQLHAVAQRDREAIRLLLGPLADISPRAEKLVTRARYLPTEGNLRAVATELATIQWVMEEDDDHFRLRPVPLDEAGARDLSELTRTVRIEVSARQMRDPSFTVSLDSLHAIEVQP